MEMNISKEKNEKKDEKKENYGKNPKFYIALLVCLSTVTAAGWSTYKTVKNFITPPQQQNATTVNQRASRPKGETKSKEVSNKNNILESEKSDIDNSERAVIPYEKESKSVNTLRETKEEHEVESNEQVQAVWAEKPEIITISYPSTSAITKEFSDNTPVYSKTLGDWRCHEGTDFKAEKGSSVKAITSGIVTDIYEDPSYGTTVVISHDSGFTAYYSGLNEDVLVKKGNRIKNGEEIGTIDTVPCEILDEPHLHLSINKDDKFIDPILVLEKES